MSELPTLDTSTLTVLDFDTPLDPTLIEVGSVVMVRGEPRRITSVTPYAHTVGNRADDRLYAELGEGDTRLFFVLTCATCGERRAFPGTRKLGLWWGLTHDDGFRVFCTVECLMNGIPARSLDNTGDGS